MNSITLLLLFGCCILQTQRIVAQEFIDWNTLGDVEFADTYAEELGTTYQSAIFGKYVKTFEGKEVVITGYLIPLDALGINYALSRNPNSSCFFCGGAGPETVLELRLKPQAIKRYKMDERRPFKGTLVLNKSNRDRFTYVLKNAEPY